MITFPVYCVFTLLIFIRPIGAESLERHSVTACAGTGNEDCDFYKVACGARHRVRLVDQQYGSKARPCHVNTRRCGPSETSPCCLYTKDDCLQDYTEGDRFAVYQDCSGQPRCWHKEAAVTGVAGAATCGIANNTYVRIQYQCVPESSILGFCDSKRLTSGTVNVIFDGSTTRFAKPTDCLCALSARAPTRVQIHVVDARLLRMPGSRARRRSCASALLTSSNMDAADINVRCTEGVPIGENFVHNSDHVISLDKDELVYLNLEHLYSRGDEDVPMMAWLSLTADDTDELDVICYSKNSSWVPPTAPAPTAPAVPSPTAPAPTAWVPPRSSTAHTHVYIESTDNAQTGGSDDNNVVMIGAIIGGGAVVLIMAFVACIVWRRKHHHTDGQKARNSVRQSVKSRSYETIERAARSSVTAGEHYDQIGNLTYAFVSEPVYDQPYVHKPRTDEQLELTPAGTDRVPEDEEGHVYEAVQGDNQYTDGAEWDGAVTTQPHGQQQTQSRPSSNYDHLHSHICHNAGVNHHLHSHTQVAGGPVHAQASVDRDESNTTAGSMGNGRGKAVLNDYVEFHDEGSVGLDPSIKTIGRPGMSKTLSDRPPVASPRNSKAVSPTPHLPSAYSYAYTDVSHDGEGADSSTLDGYMEPISCRTKRV